MAGTGSLPNTSRAITMQSAVKAVDSDLQGWRGWWREQYNPVAMHVYRNRPDIQYAPGYLLMNRYLTADGWAWFGHDADVSIRGRTICAGQRFWPVYTWMAPAEGTVRLTGTIRRAGESAASPRVRIVKNLDGTRLPKDDVTVWDWQAITETEIVHDVTTEVTAGSVVRFIVAGAGASVQWEPAVAYVTK